MKQQVIPYPRRSDCPGSFHSAQSMRTMFRFFYQTSLFSFLRGWFDSLVPVQGDLPVMTAFVTALVFYCGRTRMNVLYSFLVRSTIPCLDSPTDARAITQSAGLPVEKAKLEGGNH